jgi:hypothetical protein
LSTICLAQIGNKQTSPAQLATHSRDGIRKFAFWTGRAVFQVIEVLEFAHWAFKTLGGRHLVIELADGTPWTTHFARESVRVLPHETFVTSETVTVVIVFPRRAGCASCHSWEHPVLPFSARMTR